MNIQQTASSIYIYAYAMIKHIYVIPHTHTYTQTYPLESKWTDDTAKNIYIIDTTHSHSCNMQHALSSVLFQGQRWRRVRFMSCAPVCVCVPHAFFITISFLRDDHVYCICMVYARSPVLSQAQAIYLYILLCRSRLWLLSLVVVWCCGAMEFVVANFAWYKMCAKEFCVHFFTRQKINKGKL